jgi:hypothetical protein
MANTDTCKLRYHGPDEVDWSVERMTRAEAEIRKQALEQAGCTVELFEASAFYARLGARLDPRKLMN